MPRVIHTQALVIRITDIVILKIEQVIARAGSWSGQAARLSELLTALLWLSIASTAFAQDIPDYDVEGYCRRIASVGGSYSESTMNFCLREE